MSERHTERERERETERDTETETETETQRERERDCPSWLCGQRERESEWQTYQGTTDPTKHGETPEHYSNRTVSS